MPFPVTTPSRENAFGALRRARQTRTCRGEAPPTTKFADVAGEDEAVAEVEEELLLLSGDT